MKILSDTLALAIFLLSCIFPCAFVNNYPDYPSQNKGPFNIMTSLNWCVCLRTDKSDRVAACVPR